MEPILYFFNKYVLVATKGIQKQFKIVNYQNTPFNLTIATLKNHKSKTTFRHTETKCSFGKYTMCVKISYTSVSGHFLYYLFQEFRGDKNISRYLIPFRSQNATNKDFSWTEAQRICKDIGGMELPTFSTKHEFDEFMTSVQNSKQIKAIEYFYLGLKFSKQMVRYNII